MMVILKRPDEIEKMRASNRIVAEILTALQEKTKPGITTIELDRYLPRKWLKRRELSQPSKVMRVILLLFVLP